MFRFALLLAALTAACSTANSTNTADPPPKTEASMGEAAAESEPSTAPETAVETSGLAARPTDATIAARVSAAKGRLQTSAAGQLVWQSIEAHGGLTPWLSSGPIHFRFAYAPTSRPPTDTVQTIDTWSARARHHLAADPSIEFGWDGRKAWISPPDADPGTNARFWALTPYYFVGLPFVLADPGVKFERLPDAAFEDETYDVVKASFEPGTGDASGDYYILYLDKESRRLEAIRYVVSYPGFYPDGGHGAEKLMSYDGEQTAAGLTFAASHRTFKFDEETGEVGEKVTDITVTDLEFRPDTPADYFAVPEGARVIEGWK